MGAKLNNKYQKNTESLKVENNEGSSFLDACLLIMEQLPVMAYGSDRNGRILVVSDMWLQKFGYDKREVLSGKVTDFFSNGVDKHRKQDLQSGALNPVSSGSSVTCCQKKDGSLLVCRLSEEEIVDKNNTYLFTLTTITEIVDSGPFQSVFPNLSPGHRHVFAESLHPTPQEGMVGNSILNTFSCTESRQLDSVIQEEEAYSELGEFSSRINRCFLKFTPNPLENINRLVKLAGIQFNASSSIYNRISGGMLRSISSWNTPGEFELVDVPEGHICYDTIRNGLEEPVVVSDLQNSDYAITDPNVSDFGLQTYVGKAVRFAGSFRGSLCVVFQDDFQPSGSELKMLTVIAAAIGIEEDRLYAQEEMARVQHYAAERGKQAMVGKIAGKMAHDFNNVLGAIMGNAEMALEDCDEESVRRSLETILSQTLRGRNLTRNLVAFAKDHEPKHQYFSVNDKIDLVLNLMDKEMHDIHVIRELSRGLSDILADPGMIEHCLVNILLNSLHSVSKTKRPIIRIRTSCKDEQICVVIRDNGCGIPEEFLDRIYEPAFTLKGGRDTTGAYALGIKGTGYGLANVKKYIEQHHGSIEVRSQVNVGTEVILKLPKIEKKLSSQEKDEISIKGVVSGKRILVVEDEQAISEVQGKILSHSPCNHWVDIAEDGQKAMDFIDSNHYDLVSLDYVLPGPISGIDVYNHLRTQKLSTPVLFVSGNLEFLESIKLIKQADSLVDHVTKPCKNKEYINGINALLEMS